MWHSHFWLSAAEQETDSRQREVAKDGDTEPTWGAARLRQAGTAAPLLGKVAQEKPPLKRVRREQLEVRNERPARIPLLIIAFCRCARYRGVSARHAFSGSELSGAGLAIQSARQSVAENSRLQRRALRLHRVRCRAARAGQRRQGKSVLLDLCGESIRRSAAAHRRIRISHRQRPLLGPAQRRGHLRLAQSRDHRCARVFPVVSMRKEKVQVETLGPLNFFTLT